MAVMRCSMGELRDKTYCHAPQEPQTAEEICNTKVLKAGDPCILSPGIQGGRLKEADGVLRRGVSALEGRFFDSFK